MEVCSMKVIELEAGQHDSFVIDEPTCLRSVAPHPWDAVIRPSDANLPCVNARAPVRIEGCTLMQGRFGLRSNPGVYVEIDHCWIHQARQSGFFTPGPLRIHRSLIEYNGLSGQYGHGVYAYSDLRMTNSIVWANSAWGVTHTVVGPCRMEMNLIGNHRTGGKGAIYVYYDPDSVLELERNTFCGSVAVLGLGEKASNYKVPKSNLIADDIDDRSWAISSSRRLYWLGKRSEHLAGRGCYDYYPQFSDLANKEGAAYAAKLWHDSGWMWAVKGSWTEEPPTNMYHNYHEPHFPGDPLPTLTGGE